MSNPETRLARLYHDEWWPVLMPRFDLDAAYGDAVMVDRETYERWRAAFAAFAAIQAEIQAVLTGDTPGPDPDRLIGPW